MKLKNTYQIHFFYALIIIFIFSSQSTISQGFEGYYRYPDIHGNKIIFSAEDDLWNISINGGLAHRLTTHAEEELFPSISPDGKLIAFSANYEGPGEVYTMPIDGGLPQRWTFESNYSTVNCWTPKGEIIYNTRAYSTLPDAQLVSINLNTKIKNRIPLSQASEASYNQKGNTVYFVRPSDHRNVTKRYKGGTARQIWKYTNGEEEAIKLTNEYKGESHHPMWWNNRVYFISDRDGIMNIWSINENGGDLKQHTHHKNFDVRYANQQGGRIVYQKGADIWMLDIESSKTNKIKIKLSSDLDQLREKWVNNPSKYITSVQPDFKGEKIVITARGRVFIAPVKQGRFINFSKKNDYRLRDAVFSAKGEEIIALSDESGEFEFIKMNSNGIGESKPITTDGNVLRYGATPSPDGTRIAYDDLRGNLFILNLKTGVSKKISTNNEGILSFSWSPDSKWIAFVQIAENTMAQINIFNINQRTSFKLTSDRANSLYPKWSPDGKFIYFLSDRNFHTLVGSPWGTRQPEPYFDISEKLYIVPLQKNCVSPFRPSNELNPIKKKKEDENKTVNVLIDIKNIAKRIEEVPVKPGNYRGLEVTNKAIFLLSSGTGSDAKTNLSAIKIGNENVKLNTVVEKVNNFKLTGNNKKILISKDKAYYMVDASSSKISDLSKSKINLNNWKFSINPREDWKQIFTDAWRMERDYFYDENMHGVNWKAMHDKYFPLVDRITTRLELSDLIGRFVGELAALHTSVRGGDIRKSSTNISVASLGARLKRDIENKGYKIEHIYQTDPDYPAERSPLADPSLNINTGDIITHINGKSTLSVVDIGALIRNQKNQQVRLSLNQSGNKKDVIVIPNDKEYSLRYRDWEYSRRLEVESKSNNKIGYVHLQAMGTNDINQWYKEFYPVFNRQGLIIDVRHNRGGNIESFILEKLMRKAWMYWKSRSGKPRWNMQYAFRGHIVILVDENTASDGEAFADGFKKLNLGTAIGMRTWGGEIWLSSVNRLSDGGIARAPMSGVYGNNRQWLIEGHGFEPDIVIDNLPHATFKGKDAQLEKAINILLDKIKDDPRDVPKPPPFPDKSFNNK